MTTTYKTLAQSIPSATTNTDIYTVGASTSTVASTLSICNQGATNATVNVAIRVAGAAITAKQYILFTMPINAYQSIFLTLGITLGAADVITVYATTANVSFNLFGSEIS